MDRHGIDVALVMPQPTREDICLGLAEEEFPITDDFYSTFLQKMGEAVVE